MRQVGLIAIALLGSACGSPPSGPPCDVRTDRMDVTLSLLSDVKQVFMPQKGVRVLDLPDGKAIRIPGPSIAIEPDGDVIFRGQMMGQDRNQLGESIAMTREFGREAEILYVVADPDLTLGTLDEILAAVPWGYELRLAGYGPAIQLDVYQDRLREVKSVKKFEAAMSSTNPAERATAVAKALENAIGKDCADLTTVFGLTAMEEDKGRFIAREAPDALKKCKCSVKDPDLVEYLLYSVLGAYERPQVSIPLERQHGPSMSTVANLVR